MNRLMIRTDLQDWQAYPVENIDSSYRLHANELPWSPLGEDEWELNYYPNPEASQNLTRQLALTYQLPTDQILLTRGSDEAIDLLIRLIITPGQDSIMTCSPTFSMYGFFARLQQAAVIDQPLLAPDFKLDVEGILADWPTACKLLFLCSPNNPTGSMVDESDLRKLCESLAERAWVVVDEAYIEFADQPSASNLLKDYDNLIILRTLSKAYGLAGLRLGSLLAQPALVQQLKAIMPPYPFSKPVLSLATQALASQDWFIAKQASIKSERHRLMKQLQAFEWIHEIYPSGGNFILFRCSDAAACMRFLSQHEIIIRSFPNHPRLGDCLRITVSQPEQNDHVMQLLTEFTRLFAELCHSRAGGNLSKHHFNAIATMDPRLRGDDMVT
jgi:histidinol-phosphate aminotransferase